MSLERGVSLESLDLEELREEAELHNISFENIEERFDDLNDDRQETLLQMMEREQEIDLRNQIADKLSIKLENRVEPDYVLLSEWSKEVMRDTWEAL